MKLIAKLSSQVPGVLAEEAGRSYTDPYYLPVSQEGFQITGTNHREAEGHLLFCLAIHKSDEWKKIVQVPSDFDTLKQNGIIQHASQGFSEKYMRHRC